MNGTLYGVGVGPGDPKLMTYLAVEKIRESQVIAVPDSGSENAVSLRIASGMIPDLDQKECLSLHTPMTKDKAVLEANYRTAAEKIIEKLQEGKDVAYLTLGDPTIYSTYIYIHRMVRELGYEAEIINGIPSFCLAAAKLGDSLADRSEQIHILPSTYDIEQELELPGTKILMKAASKIGDVKKTLQEKELEGTMIENCGMSDEHIYESVEEIPEKASYYSLVVVKDGR